MNEESNMQALAAQHLDYSKKIGQDQLAAIRLG